MMRFEMVVALFPDVVAADLADWIARGWIEPKGTGRADWLFTEVEVARIGLIRDLRLRMELDADALALVLSLLDQIYALRGALQSVMHALEEQPPAVRAAVLAAIAGNGS